MADHREAPRWRASRALTVGCVTAGILLGFAPVMTSPLTDGLLILGLPASYVLAGVIAPLLIVVTIFWSANSQDRIDRRYYDLQD